MKKSFGPLLALLLLSQTPSFAQSDLVLVIDRSTFEIDWLNGTSITMLGGFQNRFGTVTYQGRYMAIDSPQATYYSPSGTVEGGSTIFQFSENHKNILGIILGTSLPPEAGSSFSGTPAGPAIPTISPIFATPGSASWFADLDLGNYTLTSGAWSGGIQIVVVPEPATWSLMLAGLGSFFAWRRWRTRSRP